MCLHAKKAVNSLHNFENENVNFIYLTCAGESIISAEEELKYNEEVER